MTYSPSSGISFVIEHKASDSWSMAFVFIRLAPMNCSKSSVLKQGRLTSADTFLMFVTTAFMPPFKKVCVGHILQLLWTM